MSCVQQFRSFSKLLRHDIKEGKTKYVENVVQKANEVKGSDIYRELKRLRVGASFRKKAIQTLPQLCNEQGEEAGDAYERDSIWSRHCAKMEAGVRTTTKRLLMRSRRNATYRWNASDEHRRHLHEVPTLQELEGCFRRVRMNKAPGADRLRSDLCHLASTEMARKFHPLLTKMFWRREEPIQMKGGILV